MPPVAYPSTIVAEGVTVSFGTVRALDSLSTTVGGGVAGLIGPNGAGKTTLLRTFMGFERPSAGTVLVRGVDPFRSWPELSGHVAFLPQRPPLYGDLTAVDHLRLVGRSTPRFNADVAQERLTRRGVPTGRPTRGLSVGQKVEVALAIVLAVNAEVLLLDEPLASLDPVARAAFLADLRAHVASGNRTAVLSSHIVTDLEAVTDHVILIDRGEAILSEATATLRDAYCVEPIGSISVSGMAFHSSTGSPMVLVRRNESGAAARPATLEEVVLAILTARAQGQQPVA